MKAYLHFGSMMAAALATPAFAQDVQSSQADTPSSESAGGLEEIVVTAQKRSENLQKVPIAISAFSAATLEKQQTRDISDLTGQVPSLVITQSGAGIGAANVSLRGIFFQDVEKSFEPGVGVVVDGVYLSTSTGQLLQSFDFAQVEVLRGPQGTLFGKNTTGGAINVTRTRPDPSGQLSGKARVTLGSFGRNDYEAVISAPLIEDRLALKIAGFSMNDHGAWDNTTTGRHAGAKDYQALSVSLRATPSEDFDIQLTYDHTEDNSDIPPLLNLYSPLLRPTGVPGLFNGNDSPCSNPNLANPCPALPPAANKTRQNLADASYTLDAVTMNARADLGPLAFVSVTGYRKSSEDALVDFDASELPLFLVRRPQKFEQFSQEMRIESEFGGPFKFVAGIYYFNSTYSLNQVVFLDIAALAPIPLGAVQSYSGARTSQRSDSIALFFQGDYEITDALTLTLGARQSWDDKRFNFTQFSQVTGSFDPADFFNPVNQTTLHATFSEFTPRVALRYEFTPQASAYASFSRGYNSGGFNGRGGNKLLLGPYAPEIVKAYEAGFKVELFDRMLRVNGAIFQNDFSNKQEEVTVTLPVAPFTGTTVQNVSSARYRGAELEVSAAPTEGLILNASLGYLEAKYTKFIASLRPGTPVVDVSNLKLRRAPKWTASFAGDYEIPIGPGKLGVNTTVRYVDAIELNILNDPFGHVPATTKIDASIRYDWTMSGLDFRATLFGKNLTDKMRINALQNSGRNSFVDFASQDIGRTYGIELQLKF